MLEYLEFKFYQNLMDIDGLYGFIMIRYFQYFVGQFCCFDHLTGILNGYSNFILKTAIIAQKKIKKNFFFRSFLNGLQNNSVVERVIQKL